MNGWTVVRVVAPRATYRLRFGHWCDHQTYYAQEPIQDQVPVAIRPLVPVNHGWGPWEMIDLGRAKIRSCQRCGHVETTMPHPMRDMAREMATRPGVQLAMVVAWAVGSLALLTWLMLWVFPAWMDVVIVLAVVLSPTGRRLWRL